MNLTFTNGNESVTSAIYITAHQQQDKYKISSCFAVFHAVAGDARVAAAGERGVLLEGLVGEGLDVIEVERTLGGDALGVAVLVLHHAEHGRVVVVEQLGDAPACLAEDQPLRRGRGVLTSM